MQKAVIYLLIITGIFFTSCHTHKSAMGDACPHGETRKGNFKGDKWSDLRNHQ